MLSACRHQSTSHHLLLRARYPRIDQHCYQLAQHSQSLTISHKKIALVTAESADLGACIAKALVRDGMRVIINYSSNNSQADALVAELRTSVKESSTSTRDYFMAIKADMGLRDSVKQLVEETYQKMGRIDVVVLNAGWTKMRELPNLEDGLLWILRGSLLGMMTAWHTITKIGPPSLLAIDTANQIAYLALDISETRLFINRFRGDYGFFLSFEESQANHALIMSPPTNRTKACREQLWQVSNTVFSEKTTYNISVGNNCFSTELGWNIVDPGTNGNGSTTPLLCIWPDAHPYDNDARVALVVDEELGFVVQSGMIPGMVEPYGNISAFIPNASSVAQVAQDDSLKQVEGKFPLPAPIPATRHTLEGLQSYDGKLQAMQINVYLSGPNQTSPWLY